ncbi:copper resistance CopC family protein [Micromonospora deserti]|uniref:copper resistance CopC family protein n=1 Tax=Micromonospora deserti TaxID=2070366 RepID=UPI001314A851|nr:copper resistance CopC family protein [Micromonospora deserti]
MLAPGRRTLAVTTALVGVGLAVAVGATARQSTGEPARVLRTTPADGAALAAGPGEVVLRLSTRPDPALSHVTVRDSAGTTVNAGRLSTDEETLLRQPARLALAGDYSVAYHVTFANGRDAAGVLRFSVGTGSAPRSTDPIPDAVPDTDGHAHGVDPVGATLLVLDGVVLVAVLVLLRLRPAPRRPLAPSATGHPDPPADRPAGPPPAELRDTPSERRGE